MKGRKNRIYREGSAHHLYLKALRGDVLFYRTEDFIFYLTLFYVLAERYGIGIDAMCIMFNHAHAFVKPVRKLVFNAFSRYLQSLFARGYNEEYHRSGPLMMLAGYAPKTSQKSILSCIIYILNNPVAGKLVRRAQDYKWNFIAYFQSDHPFSDRLVKRESSSRMRKALSLVDDCHRKGQYLNYAIQRQIFGGLTRKEKKQVTDYIIMKYNPVDKDSLVTHFGSYDKALLAMEASVGAEHDLQEPWEDYSVYANMLKVLLKSWIDHKGFRFKEMDKHDLRELLNLFSKIPNMTEEHIHRFLHLKREKK